MASNSKNLVPTVFKHYTTHDQARDTGTLNGPHGESTEETMQRRLSCTVKNQSQKTCWSAWGCRPLFQNGGHFLITMPSPGRPNHLQVTELTLFHNLVPLTVGHALPRSPPPIISPWFTWNNPHTENPLAFSLFKQHTVYTHITTTTPLIIETAYLLGLSSWSQGPWFLILTSRVSHTVPGTLETQKTMFACVLIKAVLIAVRPNG